MKNKLVFTLTMIVVGAFLLVGCGGKSCTTLCEEAQAGKCTSIKGDCTKFCAALEAEYSPANCATMASSF